MRLGLSVYADAQAVARAVADAWVRLAREAVEKRGRFGVALAGGGTPRPAYELLATLDFASRAPWKRTHVFWGDERCVPPDHADSNYRMAREALLDRVPIPPENVHRVLTELPPDEAARAYAQTLQRFFSPGSPPRFDLVLLGMGEDGHTASLFPETAALEEHARYVCANRVSQRDVWRVTLTLPALNAARHVRFLVTGRAKAATLARVHGGEPLPAARVDPDNGEVTWLVAAEAAALLPVRLA